MLYLEDSFNYKSIKTETFINEFQKGRKKSWKHPGNVDTSKPLLNHKPCNYESKCMKEKTGLNSTSVSYLISKKLTYSNAEEKVNVNVSTILVFNHRRKSSDQNRIRVQVSQLF